MEFASQTKGKTQEQSLGIDRVIHLKTGKTIHIDEKKRREVFNDFALEYKSVSDQGEAKPGWIVKSLLIDYIAYAFMPIQTVYLLDWLSLKRAWREKCKKWKEDGFFIAKAQNKGYVTYSLCVPVETLLNEINKPIKITL